MTLTDKLIPYYYWFKNGFGEISLPLGLFNFATIVIIAFTQKGIEISLYAVPVIALVIIAGLVFVGWFMEHYQIYSRITVHAIAKQNPVMVTMCEDIKAIKAKLEIE